MLKLDRIKKKYENHELIIGTHLDIAEPVTARIIAQQGYDVIWIDMEHSPIDRRDLNYMLMALESTPAAVFVRVPDNTPAAIKPILEMKVDGVIFPNVATLEEAKLGIQSAIYPPVGIRGYGPQGGRDFGNLPMNEYIDKDAKELFRIVQIEDWRAVDIIDQICARPGISAIQIGPVDLSASMGKLGHVDEEVWAVYERYVKKARECGILVGTSMGYNSGAQDVIDRWLKLGVDWINCNTDINLVANGAKANLDDIRASALRVGLKL